MIGVADWPRAKLQDGTEGQKPEPKSAQHLHGFLNLYYISHPSAPSHLWAWKNEEKSEWFPDLPIFSDKTIPVLIAAHPCESWPEQPEASLHCK